MSDYSQIENDLMVKLSVLERRLESLRRDRRRSVPLDRDFAEQAVQRENDEVIDALEEAARREIGEIRRTLARLSDSDYGSCVRCGDDIPPERLRARPTARRCVVCAYAAEVAAPRLGLELG